MRKSAAITALAILVFGQTAYAASCQNGDTRVLQGIPPIAKVFAPLVGANWEDFARDLAGICAVESKCSPTYPHYLQNGGYSQYQGLYQMNMYEVAKAENYLNQVYPQLQRLEQSGQIPQDAWTFFQQALQAGRSSSGDRRFLPEYGVILGAAKHIQIQRQLERQYPGDPLRQAAGHMTAQFSGITESKIAAGNFNAPVTGVRGDASTELGALGANRVTGMTVAGAIESAGATYGACMAGMMTQMSQVTGGLTSVPKVIAPFNAPAYQPGSGPMLGIPYSGVSTLMETGVLPPTLAPSVAPISGGYLPPLNSAAPQYTQPSPASQPTGSNTATPPAQSTPLTPNSGTGTSACAPQYYCSNNTVYYRSDSCATNVFEQCQYGCQGTICAPSPTVGNPSPSANMHAAVTGASMLGIPGTIGNPVITTPAASISSSLDTSIHTIVPGQNPWQTAGNPSNAQPGQNSSYASVTLTTTYANPSYAPSGSPFFEILNQLRSVLNGLLAYLGSL